MANNIINTGKQTIIAESDAVAALLDSINESFEKAVLKIFQSKGRLVVWNWKKRHHSSKNCCIAQ